MCIYQKDLQDISISLNSKDLTLSLFFDDAHFQTILSISELEQLAQMFREAIRTINYDKERNNG